MLYCRPGMLTNYSQGLLYEQESLQKAILESSPFEFLVISSLFYSQLFPSFLIFSNLSRFFEGM